MKILRILLVVTIVLSLVLFVRATDMQQVMASMQQVGFKFVILLFVTFLASFFATIGWKYCMGEPGKNLSLWDLFFIRVVGEAVGLVNPTSVVGGEAVKVFLLREKEIEQKTVLASILISRVLMALTQLLLFVFAAVLLFYKGGASFRFSSVPTALYIAIAGSIVTIYFLIRNSWLKDLIRPTAFGANLARRTVKFRKQLAELRLDLSLFYKNNKKDLALSSFFFALHWVLGGLEFYYILLFLGVKATVIQALLVDMGVVIFKSAGAFIPGQIGIEEYGNKVMLSMIGAPGTEIWVAASILRRARQLFWIAFGLISYFAMSKKWGSALRQP